MYATIFCECIPKECVLCKKTIEKNTRILIDRASYYCFHCALKHCLAVSSEALERFDELKRGVF